MYISCIFHIVCASFSTLATRKLADAKAVFSGIWAIDFRYYSMQLCKVILYGYRDTTHSIVAIQGKIVLTEKTIEIQLVRPTEVCCKV